MKLRILCSLCHAPEHRLEPLHKEFVRCLDCGERMHRSQLLRNPTESSRPRPRRSVHYRTDYYGLCYPSTWWPLYAQEVDGVFPRDPLRTIEDLADWERLNRQRRWDCGECLAWSVVQGEASRPVRSWTPDPGPDGSCCRCALSRLDAVDDEGREVDEVPASYLARHPRSTYRELEALPSERVKLTFWGRLRRGEHRPIERPEQRLSSPTVTAEFDPSLFRVESGFNPGRWGGRWSAGGWREHRRSLVVSTTPPEVVVPSAPLQHEPVSSTCGQCVACRWPHLKMGCLQAQSGQVQPDSFTRAKTA